jgi:hypothetical protein
VPPALAHRRSAQVEKDMQYWQKKIDILQNAAIFAPIDGQWNGDWHIRIDKVAEFQ